MQDKDKSKIVSRSSDRIGCVIGINGLSLDIAGEGEDVGAEPREEIDSVGVSFIGYIIGRGVTFG